MRSSGDYCAFYILSSTIALHQMCSVSKTSSFWPGLIFLQTCFSDHFWWLLILSFNRVTSYWSILFLCLLYATNLTAESICSDRCSTHLRISLRQLGHSRLRNKLSLIHSSQKEWPQIAVRQLTMKSIHIEQCKLSTCDRAYVVILFPIKWGY